MRLVFGVVALGLLLPAAPASADEVLLTRPAGTVIDDVAAAPGALLWTERAGDRAQDHVFLRQAGVVTDLGRGTSVRTARGAGGRRLAVFRRCSGTRCAIVRVDLGTRHRRTVRARRVLGATASGHRLVWSQLRGRRSRLTLPARHLTLAGRVGALSAAAGRVAWLRENGGRSIIEGRGATRCTVAFGQGDADRMMAPVLDGRTLYWVLLTTTQDPGGSDPIQDHPTTRTWTAERAALGSDGCPDGDVTHALLGRRIDHSIPRFGAPPSDIEGDPVADGGPGAFTGDIAIDGGRLLEVTTDLQQRYSIVARDLQFAAN